MSNDLRLRASAALNATTPKTPEGLQYVLIRGLSAMGHAHPALESWELVEAALKSADAAAKAIKP
jgi:hypothetical protein